MMFFSLSILAAFVTSAHAGTVRGRVVTDDTGQFVRGATVAVEGTSFRTATNDRGEYSIAGVPAGTYTLRVSYLTLQDAAVSIDVPAQGDVEQAVTMKSERQDPTAETVQMDAFVVESFAEGQAKAINQQRAADTVVNIISADAVGALPDETLGQALNRVVGINVVDDSKVSIRGNDAALNSITLDGSRLHTPEAGTGMSTDRSINLADIPSEVIGGIEVFKVLTPDMSADSFGGTVNLITRSALDFNRRILNTKFEYRFRDFRANFPERADGFAGTFTYGEKLTDRLGVLFTASYIDEAKLVEYQDLLYHAATSGAVVNIPGMEDFGLTEVDRRIQLNKTKDIGLNGTVDFRLSDTTDLFFKINSNTKEEDRNYWRLRRQSLQDFDSTSTPDLQTGNRARHRNRRQNELIDTTSIRLNVGGVTTLDPWKFEYRVNYTDSKSDLNQRRTNFEHTSSSRQRANDFMIDRSNPDFPTITVTHRASGQPVEDRPQDIALTQVRAWDWVRENTNIDGQFDVSRALETSKPTRIKVGTRWIANERIQNNDLQDFNPNVPTDFPMSFFPLDDYIPAGLFGGVETGLGRFPLLDPIYAHLANNPNLYSDAFDDAGQERLNERFNLFELSEDIIAGYAMGTTDFGALRAIYGVRVEQTDFSADWLGAADGRPVKNSGEYTDVFPGAILTYRLGKSHVFRAAWTNTIARPDLSAIVPRDSVIALNPDPEAIDQPGTFNRGNPDLVAQESMNFDLSYEYYYRPTGLVGVQLFHKDISKFIYTSAFSEVRPYTDPLTGETLDGTFIIERPENGKTQKLTGLELSWDQKLGFLPGPLSGLGFSANATFIKGESEFVEQDPTTNEIFTIKEDFVLAQPDRIYNVQLYWDWWKISARIAYNYRGDFRRTQGTRTSLLPVIEVNDVQEELSAQVNFRVSQKWRLFVNGRNLSEAPRTDLYERVPTRPTSYRYEGWNGSIGVRTEF